MNYTLNGIKVSIRSATSEHNYINNNPYFNYFDDTNILTSRRNGTTEIRDIITNILHTIRNDTTIQKDDTICLDIEEKKSTKESTCSICQNMIKIDDSISELTCSHVFHYDCITEWGKYKPSCPLCRVDIPYHSIFIDSD